MDECSGEVMPFPKEVASGIRSFTIGLNVAFLLAGAAHVFLTQAKRGNGETKKSTSFLNLSLVLSIIVHLVSLSESTGQVSGNWQLSYVTKDFNSVQSSLMQNRVEAAIKVMLSIIVWSKLTGVGKHIVLALCVSNALLMTMLRSTSDERYGLMYFMLTMMTGLASIVATATVRKETRAAGVLCAAFTLLLGFQHALYLLQANELVQAPVANLCFALIAGCVRFAFTVVCAEIEHVPASKVQIEEIREEEGENATVRHTDELADENTVYEVESAEGGDAASGLHSELHSEAGSDSGSEPEHQLIDPLLARSSSFQTENVSRRELLRYVFHEMRAPLNSICMAVDLLTHHYKGGTTPKSKVLDLETLQIIEEATLTMERTLKDSMTLQKIEEGLLRPQMKIFSVHDMCDDIQDALSSVLQSTSVQLLYNVEAAIPEQIAADHFRVRHVVAHLLSNAIKFSRVGGVVNMKVFLHTMSPAELLAAHGAELPDSARTASTEGTVPGLNLHAVEREYVVFTISDSGVGMSSELQESDIFKPFNQLKTEEVSGFRGSGLGLAICKKIMSFLEGSISYSSIEGVGTTFTVMFPLTRLDEGDDEEEEDAADAFEGLDAPLMSPRTMKAKAVGRAKSFRGEKLLSILYNQSNVFECPTPKVASSASEALLRDSFDSQDSPKMFSPGPSASRPTSGRMAVAFRSSVKEILIPSLDDYDPRPRRSWSRSRSHDGSEFDDGPQFQLDLEGHSPAKTWRKTFSPHVRSVSSPESAQTMNRALSQSIDTAAAFSSQNSSFRSDAQSELQDALQRSPPLQARSIEPKSDYVALTEKNVNLHILRTASNEGVRALRQKLGNRRFAATREELVMVLSQCKVLVVDDAPSNRKLLSMLLKRAGFGTVDLVEDGQAAVDYCRDLLTPEQQPSIIFMDNTMPKMTGIEASKIIRAHGFKHLIIGVTGNSLEEELDEFIAAGADLVIVKPLKNQSLEMLLGFVQTNGFDSSHGYRIDLVGQQYTWVPRGHLADK